MTTPVVAVVGGGASGTLAAAHLAASAAAAGRQLELLLVEPGPPGQGAAYSTLDRRHRLNVPAGRMSAWPKDPDHFLRWLRAHTEPTAGASDFAARADYGRYLADVLDEALAAAPGVHIEVLATRATGIARHGRRLRLRLGLSASRAVDAAVLAIGGGRPSIGWAPKELRNSSRFVPDPWAPGALDAVAATGPIVLVGTGLTMADVAVRLGHRTAPLHVVSRRGLLPLPHAVPSTVPQTAAPSVPNVAPPTLPDGPLPLPAARRLVIGHVRRTVDAGRDWREAVDSLRPITTQIWRGLDEADRRAFLAGPARRWDRVRHRVEPTTGAWLADRRASGALRVHTGEVVNADVRGERVTVQLSDGQRVDAAGVINCTGPCGDLRTNEDALVLELFDSGMARPGPLNLGLDTDDDGRLLAETGAPSAIWTLGPTRRGQLWESTAIPEIRSQAAALAEAVVAQLPQVRLRRRPRDLYGLPLTTTTEAADLYNAALGRILRVQSGADALVADAVAADPDFALGHATLALLGSEWGAEIDVPSALAACARATAHTDERERRFVQVVTDRILRPGPQSGTSLLAHIRDYPEDALAVSAAVPTIAFAGATEIPEEAWALVEGLAPAYGADWWYAGLLAFIRQEQERFEESAELADRALAAEPAAGHAVHARAHVFYETGQHVAGLAWLDPWITRCGRAASHQAHFSWHAALHELALGHDEAVADRYLAQLAPPAVTGVRALVDSAALLWRGHATGAWEWPGMDQVLAGIPADLLDDPPTPFIALHAAVALAAAGDTAGLDRLERQARHRDEPGFRRTVAPLAAALAALTRGDFGQATDGLLALDGVDRLGGSAAQRDIIEETLLFTAVSARRFEVATAVLQRRLDRRPSPRDTRRLHGVAAHPAALPAVSRPITRTRPAPVRDR